MAEKKIVPRLRFREFKELLPIVKLNDILFLLTDFEANGSFADVKSNVKVLNEKDHAWYVRATDLENNTALENVKYVDRHSYDFLKKTPLFGNELLITKRGQIGKVYFFEPQVKIKATVAPNMYLLKLNSNVESKFVYYYFKNNNGNNKLKRINASSTIGALYKDDVKAIKITLPSLPEQQKIAEFLSSVDKKIQLLEKKKEQLELYKKGVMQKIFSREIRFKDDNGNSYPDWEEKKLGDIIKLQGGYAFKSSKFRKEGVPVIRISNISNKTKYLDLEKLKYYDEQIDDINFTISKGDLLIAMSGATTGKSSISDFDGKAYLNQRVGLFRSITTKLEYQFLTQFVFSHMFFRQLGAVLVAGAQPNISPKEIQNFKLNFPIIEEQKKIAGFLSAIDSKIETTSTQIDKTKEFKKGLLQQMFV